MVTIELSELRDRADEVAASLRRGETLAFADEGRVVSVSSASDAEPEWSTMTLETRIEEAARRGLITPAKNPDGMKEFLAQPPLQLPPGKSLLQHVLDARNPSARAQCEKRGVPG